MSSPSRLRPLRVLAAVPLLLLPGAAHPMPGPGGADAAEATVQENTGAARYRIPIEVPPGPAGFAPELALVYSSRTGDGPFGVGWGLPFLSEVRCSARFGAPDYASCPRFELDGQLLTQDGATSRYHPFVESFEKIERIAASDTWQVTSTDGIVRRYGTTPDSRVEASPGVPARWLLSEMQAFENHIFITYDRSDAGMAYPSRITYGPSASPGSGELEIVFVYEPRPDPMHDFAGGIQRDTTRRLREVQVLTNGAVVRRYGIGYDLADLGTTPTEADYATGRSRLAWAQVYGTDCADLGVDPRQSCTGLPPQQFRYTDPADVLGPGAGSAWEHTSAESPPRWVPPHFDAGENYPPYSWRFPVRLADVNGDGLQDYIDFGKYAMRVYLNTGDDWVEDPAWSNALAALRFETPKVTMSLVDVTEICSASIEMVESPVEVGLFFVGGWAPPVTVYGGTDWSPPHPPHTSWVQLGGNFELMDLDADGLADLVMSVRLSSVQVTHDCDGQELDPLPPPTGPTDVRVVFRNTGSGWVKDDTLAAGLPLFKMLMIESSWYLFHQDPDGVISDDTYCGPFLPMDYGGAGPCLNYADLSPVFRDLDGDGRLDLIVAEPQDPTAQAVDDYSTQGYWNPGAYYTPTRSRAWLWRATGWARAPAFDLPFHHAFIEGAISYPSDLGPPSTTGDIGVRMADFNRDGYSDVVWTEAPFGDSPPRPPRGVLLNRGRGDGSPYSAWCSSVPLTGPEGGVDLCPPDAGAGRYEPPEGEAFASEVYPQPPTAEVWTQSLGLALADVNGDGWTDYVRADPQPDDGSAPVYKAWLYSPSDGWVVDDRFEPPIPLAGQFCYILQGPPGARVLDVNGDGAVDFLRGLSSGCSDSNESFVSRAHQRPDLLREIRNGHGGTLQVAYDSAARQRDGAAGGLEDRAADDAALRNEAPGDPPADVVRWTTRPVVTAVTVRGPNTTSATTRYRYAHPRFCRASRADLGFRLVELTCPLS